MRMQIAQTQMDLIIALAIMDMKAMDSIALVINQCFSICARNISKNELIVEVFQIIHLTF